MNIQDVINYVNETPNNTNPAVLKGMIEAIVESSESGDSSNSVTFIHFELGEYDSEESRTNIQSDKTFDEIYSVVTSENVWIAELSDGTQSHTVRSCTAFPDEDNPNGIMIEFYDISSSGFISVHLSPTYMYIPGSISSSDDPGNAE